MAIILSGRKSTYGGPYAFYSCDVSPSGRTPTSVYLSVTAYGYLQYSNSWLGTGSGYGLIAGIYVGGWHTWWLKSESTKWSGTTQHSAATGFYVGVSPGTTALGASFRVLRSGSGTSAQLNSTGCSNIGIASVAATYNNVALAATANSQAQATAKITGLPGSVGYARTIEWYNGDTKIATDSIAASASATSYSKVFTGLLPNTSYTFKAIVKYGTTALSSKTVAVTTKQETGEISVTPQSTLATVAVTGMFNSPNYTRAVELYAKKSGDSAYTLIERKEVSGTSTSFTASGLISNEEYDFKVLIKNGSTTLVTLEEKAVLTLTDTSLIPTAHISVIIQQLGTRKCTLEWSITKDVAGTTYKIQAQVAGAATWTTLATLDAPEAETVVVSPAGNEDMVFRITSENEQVVSETVNISNLYAFYVRDDFVWDIEKVPGRPMIITAVEWNRLAEYAVARNLAIGNTVIIPVVRTGEMITAATYNIMRGAINNVSPVGILEKRPGDAIFATDIDALRVAINTVEEGA